MGTMRDNCAFVGTTLRRGLVPPGRCKSQGREPCGHQLDRAFVAWRLFEVRRVQIWRAEVLWVTSDLILKVATGSRDRSSIREAWLWGEDSRWQRGAQTWSRKGGWTEDLLERRHLCEEAVLDFTQTSGFVAHPSRTNVIPASEPWGQTYGFTRLWCALWSLQ